jgi:hypothetical protein
MMEAPVAFGLDTIAAGLLTNFASTITEEIFKGWWGSIQRQRRVSDLAEHALALDLNEALTQNQMKARFAGLGLQLVRDLGPLFSGAAISADERKKIVDVAAAGFAVSGISGDLLTQLSLKPDELAAHVRSTYRDPVVDLSPEAQKLYERLVFEACRRIVTVASSLPEFQWARDQELLERTRDLPQRLDEILDRFRESDLASGRANRSDPDAASFETDFREAVARKLDRLELFGVERLSATSRSQPLSVAFVSLHCSSGGAVRHGRRPKSLASLAPDETTGQLSMLHDDPTRRRDRGDGEAGSVSAVERVEEVVTRTQRLLLRGPAGSGKSTILQWIGDMAGRRSFRDELVGWNRCVPFFIRLRDHLDGSFPGPADLVRA